MPKIRRNVFGAKVGLEVDSVSATHLVERLRARLDRHDEAPATCRWQGHRLTEAARDQWERAIYTLDVVCRVLERSYDPSRRPTGRTGEHPRTSGLFRRK